ncbi:helix-turn-helix domain protein [Geobacter sp. OR-1]|uniref:helix-turn-helix domain-containing protein n=1 Tax=Geobacter sp. OR-1 TaxID=1266765 RepID=UPI000542A7B8|nr:XRE family transcriptional regulator [Geobacter sp. OR-1]GAM08381.1 helix-turn-helix domain protein [Geobacter sp. OR-1]
MSRMELAERLRKAREAVGLSIGDAATRLGFTNYQTLSNIEKGEREVKASELAQFAKTYFCNLNNLLMGDDIPQPAVHFLWRRAPSERKTEIEASIKHRFEEYHLLEKLLGLVEEGSGPVISVSPADIRTYHQVDALAAKVSNLLNMGSRPALSLQKVMEQMLRTKILFIELSEFGSAASTVHPEFGAAIVVNSEEAPWRINFTLAHELFHIITWNTFNPSDLEQDEALFKDIEKKAERFASTLLLPESAVREELNARIKEQKLSFSDIVDIAREFGVSTQALLYRMANMRFIEWEKANDLARNDELLMIDRRIRRDADYEAPSSERFTLLAVKCLRKGLISRGKFSELLEIDRADIDEFLEYRGLSEAEGESIEIMAS